MHGANTAQTIGRFFMDVCSNDGYILRLWYDCSGAYIYNVADMFVQGHMQVMSNICITVLLVTLFIPVNVYEPWMLT